jgi:two-component system nitrate/nitrite response regulator NarP
MTRVLIADDHPFILAGLNAILRGTDYQVVGMVPDGAAALEALAKLRPDILILDVSMPIQSGLDVLRTLRARGDDRPIVLLTAGINDQPLLEALKLGVQGIVLKDGAQALLLTCLDAVRKGGRWIDQALLQRALDVSMQGGTADPMITLSPREKAIAALVARGLRNREIGAQLGMTEGTVKVYLHRVYEKLGVGSRTELAILAKGAEQN